MDKLDRDDETTTMRLAMTFSAPLAADLANDTR